VSTIDPGSSYSSQINIYDYLDNRSEYQTGTDDFSGGTYPSGSGSFSAGETTDTFTVTIPGDNTPENDQWFATSITATGGFDEVQVVYDNPDQPDGTQLARIFDDWDWDSRKCSVMRPSSI
jgi:hypothetical protein